MRNRISLFFIIVLFVFYGMGSASKNVLAAPAPGTDFTFDASTGTITGYIGSSTDIEIPSQIGGVNVTAIGNFSFSYRSSLKSITIPDSVTSIGDWAFVECTSFNSIIVDENNPVYTSEEGVLFNKAKTQLVLCAGGKDGSYVIPNSVTTIGNRAFYSCDSLSSISIPDSVTMIGEGAFAACRSLNSITVDNNNAEYASEDGVLFNKAKTQLLQCPGGKGGSYIIPDGVTLIGYSSFRECSNLIEVTIPYGLNAIEQQAFEGCSNLTNLEISNGVTSIGIYAFYGCSSLTKVTIPESVSWISDSAFGYCNSLLSAYFEGSAPILGSRVFDNTKSGFTVYYHEGETGFSNPWNGYPTTTFPYTGIHNSIISPVGGNFCNKLEAQTDITTTMKLYGNTLSSIDNNGAVLVLGTDYTVSGNIVTIKKEYMATQPIGDISLTFHFSAGKTQSFTIDISDSTASPETDFNFDASTGTITKYIGSSTDVEIPSEIGGVNVTAIGDNVFSDCINLISVTIPSSVTSFGDNVFFNCFQLTSITVDANNTAYLSENGVLYNKTKTQLIQYPIGSKSESFNLPDSVSSIGNGAFSGSNNLTNIVVDTNNLTYSSEGGVLFNKVKTQLVICPSGKSGSYIIPNGVTSIADSAFICSRLSNITIPNSVITIEDRAFLYSGISNITLPNSVTTIGWSSFWNCRNLTSISIPSSLISIGGYAFGACWSLSSITVDENNPVYSSKDNVLYNKAKTQLIQYPIGCSNETFAIPNSVTTIKILAFYGCQALTSIAIPSSVRTIESRAFSYCINLSSAYFYGNAPSLEDNVFSDVKSGFIVYYSTWATGFSYPWNGYTTSTFINTEIQNSSISPVIGSFYKKIDAQTDIITTMTPYGNTLSSIDNNGAALILGTDYTVSGNIVTIKKEYMANQPIGDTNLTFHFSAGNTQTLIINISDSVPSPETDFNFNASTGTITKYIGSSSEVVIPWEIGGVNVTAIGDNAFYGCRSITSVSIPKGVKSIGNVAFQDCSGLTSVTIPNGVTTIGDAAFYGCSGLTSVTLPNSLIQLGDWAFKECIGLTSVIIPNSVTMVRNSAFYGCSGLTSVTLPTSLTQLGDWTFGDCSALRSITIPNGVTSIRDNTFYRCNNLTSVIIPNSVTIIKNAAFQGCSRLTSVSIPDGVITIENAAFKDCSGLTSIIIPDSATSIGSSAFYGCSGLTNVTLPTSLTVLGDWAFGDCSALRSITIPNGVTAIRDNTFYRCINLTSVTIPNSVTTIVNSAFQGCSGLTSVTIPNNVTSIGYAVFQGCSGLTSITLPTSLAQLGDWVFGNCSGLTSVTIPNGVASIGASAFRDCSGLTSIIIPNGVQSIGNVAFYNCSSLASITLPTSLTQLGDWAFGNCFGLTSVTIPSSVTAIGNYAFYNCSGLTNVSIPSSVTTIEKNAFYGCNSLGFAYFEGNAPTLGAAVFDNTKAGFIVCYKTGSTGFSNPWNGYATATLKYGDVDGDGSVTQNDYNLVKQFILSKLSSFPSPSGVLAADIDGDGRITSKDEALLLRIIRANK